MLIVRCLLVYQIVFRYIRFIVLILLVYPSVLKYISVNLETSNWFINYFSDI